MFDTLNNLSLEEEAYVIYNNVKDSSRDTLINLGVYNTNIKCLYKSPFGDPTAYLVKGIVLAIRNDNAKDIIIMRKKHDC